MAVPQICSTFPLVEETVKWVRYLFDSHTKKAHRVLLPIWNISHTVKENSTPYFKFSYSYSVWNTSANSAPSWLVRESQCFSAVLGFPPRKSLFHLGLSVSSCDKSGLLCQNLQEHLFSTHSSPGNVWGSTLTLSLSLSSAKPDLLCLRCCFSYLKMSTAARKIHSEEKEATEVTTLVLAKFSALLPVFLPNHKPFCHHRSHQSFTSVLQNNCPDTGWGSGPSVPRTINTPSGKSAWNRPLKEIIPLQYFPVRLQWSLVQGLSELKSAYDW